MSSAPQLQSGHRSHQKRAQEHEVSRQRDSRRSAFPTTLEPAPEWEMPSSHLTVLRLYPSVPINMRQATKSTVLPVGGGPTRSSPILVRKGEAVSYSVYAMHRRKDLYGDDADHFRPERWEPSSGRSPDLRTIGWGYLPFNGGPRVCLGRKCSLCFLSCRVTSDY